MSKRKYKKGRKINNMSEFAESRKEFYVFEKNGATYTRHRLFWTSWQYRTLEKTIQNGCLYEAERMEEVLKA
jgi:hypothetical protein